MQVTNHGMTSQISEISFTKPFLCAKNSRIYPSAKGDEDLIPWVGIIGVAFCQKILRFTICAVSFCHWDLEESGDSGLPVACWDTQLPKGKTHFSRQRNPRSSQDSSATIASPTAFVTTRCQGEISGSKSTGRKTLNFQDENLPATLWFHHYPESWRCLKSPGKWPSAQKQRILVFVPIMICWKKSKKLSYYNQTESRQSMDLWQLFLCFHNISGTLCFWPKF